MVDTEMRERAEVLASGTMQHIRLSDEHAPRFECFRCRHICHLSAIICPCSPRLVACTRHAQHLCSCPPAARVLVFWHDLHVECRKAAVVVSGDAANLGGAGPF